MEFQEAMTRFMIHKPIRKGALKRDHTETEKQKWKISLHRSSSSPSSSSSLSRKPQKTKQETPKEFLCPISGSIMNDPVIISSGHTFERACVQACITLGFTLTLMDGTRPDFSNVIPNLALKAAILNWCKNYSFDPPKTLDFFSAEKLVRAKMETRKQKPSPHKKNEDQESVIKEKDSIHRVKKEKLNQQVTDTTRRPNHFTSSSDESLGNTVSTPPLQVATRPSCYSSASSSSEIETINPEEEEFITKLKSPRVFEVEEALISLRKITRTNEDTRIQLCTTRLLGALQPLIISRYINIQVNTTACLVNLSLEKVNKVKIVRSGVVPLLIDVLKGGFPEAQEHACGAIFSLALDDHNKTAIGVLGALPPLLFLLRSGSERTRHDSALALYHLSLTKSNRAKLVKLGSIPILLGLVKSGNMAGRVLLILSNLASCVDGRAAMLDSGGVECLVGMLRERESQSESTRESCVSVLYGLSHGGLRFKGLAKVAGAVEVLSQVEKSGREWSNEKVRSMLEMMRSKRGEDEGEMNWEELLESEETISETRFGLSGGKDDSCVNSSEI